jgi:putative flippase GtrA
MIAASRFFALYVSQQFGRFLLVGGVAVVLNWLSRFVLNQFMSYAWAITLAYLVGIIVAFVLNRIYVFPYSERSLETEMFLFFVVNITVFPLVWVAAYVLGEWIFVAWLSRQPALALGHGIAILSPVFLNFALHKFITFRGA